MLIYSFLYTALECLAQFVHHADGVAVDAEVPAYLHGLEVRAERAVVLSCNGDVLACEDARVALLGPGQRFDERVVRVTVEILIDDGFRVEAQYSLILLARLHCTVAAQNGLHVAAKICVVKHCNGSFREKSSVSHEEPYRPTGEVRLAYGPTLDPFPVVWFCNCRANRMQSQACLSYAEVQPIIASAIADAKLSIKKTLQMVWNVLGRIWEGFGKLTPAGGRFF